MATAGPIRLALELAIFVGGAAGWFIVGQPITGALLLILIVVHHVASRPRLRWLIAQRR